MPPTRIAASNHRITKACARCRHRKTKCDLNFPVCGSCARARVACVGYDAVRGRERPRSTVAFLEDRVAQLEIELARLKSEQTIDNSRLVEAAISALTRSLADTISDPSPSQKSRLSASSRCGLLSFASPIYLSQSPLPPLPSTSVQDDGSVPAIEATRSSTISLIPRHVIDIMLKNYSENYLPQSPYIDASQLYASTEKVYARGNETPFDVFVVAIALAISATTLIRHDEERATASAQEFWNTAKAQLPYITDGPSLQRLRVLLLLTHYGFVNPCVVDVWRTAGAATRLAVQLGLHRGLSVSEREKTDFDTIDTRRKLFWATYNLDAAIHFVVGRPFVFPREAITAEYPESIFGPRDSEIDTSPVIYVWPLRQYEAEISSILPKFGTATPVECPIPIDAWRKRALQRLEDWYVAVHTSSNGRPGEKIEFRELMYQTNLFRLNCPSMHFPTPSIEMRRASLNATIALVSIYSRNTRFGKLFYIWHAVYQLFECGVCMLETIISGIRATPSHLAGFDVSVLQRTLKAIPQLLRKVSTRWPQVERHAQFLEEAIEACLDCFLLWSRGQAQPLPPLLTDLEERLRRLMIPKEKTNGSAGDLPVASPSVAALATPVTSLQAILDNDAGPENVPESIPFTPTQVESPWNYDLLFDLPTGGLAPSVQSDELSWDFPGFDLDQIFSAFQDGQVL
ncbi:hypothetical protein IWX90DRAFT_249924 [Phyllosticta citrichinensis]|uniref:Zn(2)-C6 fungal-type domain-containing protein n=1 Tax=Phyllosticta citrichinensis TaxID=1130410 RepID=A0ABR1XR01_9PEZI